MEIWPGEKKGGTPMECFHVKFQVHGLDRHLLAFCSWTLIKEGRGAGGGETRCVFPGRSHRHPNEVRQK